MESIFVSNFSSEETLQAAKNGVDLRPVKVRSLDGDLTNAGILVSLTTASLLVIKDILIAKINKKETCTLKFRGMELTARDVDELKEILDLLEKHMSGVKSDEQ